MKHFLPTYLESAKYFIYLQVGYNIQFFLKKTTFSNLLFKNTYHFLFRIHVRRTDKVGTEAKYHKLEEYMEHAEEYFQSIELVSLKSVKRRVYIATDEPSVLKECHQKYVTNFSYDDILIYGCKNNF